MIRESQDVRLLKPRIQNNNNNYHSEYTRIRIQTVGYYHRDREFRTFPDLLPRSLNANKRYFENPKRFRYLPYINLNIDVEDYGGGEHKMESLLEYIKLKGWPNDTPPQFVTTRQLLRNVASYVDSEFRIQVVRWKGTTFLLKVHEEISVRQNFGAEFENFFTRKNKNSEESEDKGTVRKGVFLAEIPSKMGSEQCFSVLYSGEIDAIDDNGNHLEMKVFSQGLNNYFWKHNSRNAFWQALLGNVKTLVIGSRTGKYLCDPKTRPSMNLPEYSVYKVEALPHNEIHPRLQDFCHWDPSVPEWSISDGEDRLTAFLNFVKSVAKSDGDAFLITRTGRKSKSEEAGEWKVERDSEETREFRQTIMFSFP